MDTSMLKHPKPEPLVLQKRAKKRAQSIKERLCRAAVNLRDRGKCCVPLCRDRAQHLHHIVFRSQSKRLKWATGNCTSVCQFHHGMIHAGVLEIRGDANLKLTVFGRRKKRWSRDT